MTLCIIVIYFEKHKSMERDRKINCKKYLYYVSRLLACGGRSVVNRRFQTLSICYNYMLNHDL